MPRLAASILSADFARLGEELLAVMQAGADLIHIDVMDNHFVPNLSLGPMICEAVRRTLPNAFLDVHLMITPVDNMIKPFIEAGANQIAFHPEATPDIDKTIALIESLNCRVCMTLNPDTPIEIIAPWIDRLAAVLVMSVYPGFGGQPFIPRILPKISALHQWLKEHAGDRSIDIIVDGGVKLNNIGEIARAGADVLVAGSAIFHAADYVETIDKMRKIIMNSRNINL